MASIHQPNHHNRHRAVFIFIFIDILYYQISLSRRPFAFLVVCHPTRHPPLHVIKLFPFSLSFNTSCTNSNLKRPILFRLALKGFSGAKNSRFVSRCTAV
ncbi:hypothetical protein GQ43DRAFT_309861 [Delitschia confertaspora ATCC 74209]|uniref:Uncharacterized protein n=1 Tax=Delitschia confertaspora ATCC 74209 TaxID=1513339 RepID=A0A9P4JW92_9PLEO|nr:hypothetical protein GQ43DRAFT_309861 [Delitschia confertaspora ATCC 74209]